MNHSESHHLHLPTFCGLMSQKKNFFEDMSQVASGVQPNQLVMIDGTMNSALNNWNDNFKTVFCVCSCCLYVILKLVG